MRYLGGKSKTRKQISKFLESVREGKDYFEPFVGGGWILQEMSGKRTASDGNIALINMYKALQQGWVPPTDVSEDEYEMYKILQPDDDPLTAFIGFACSFAAKWFGGYARGNQRNFSLESARNLLKQLPLIQDVEFIHGTFEQHSPINKLVYCDPPYKDTTNYGAFDGFCHDTFWETMRKWSVNNTVVVSEYEAPPDFICVAEFNSRMGMTTGSEKPIRIERLFMIEPEWM